MSLVVTDAWNAISNELRRRLPEFIFDQWFSTIEITSLEEDRVEIGVQNRFFKWSIEHGYLDVLNAAIAAATGKPMRASVVISPRLYAEFRRRQEEEKLQAGAAPAEQEKKSLPDTAPAGKKEPQGGLFLNPDFTFGKIVVGACNRLAHAASLRAAEQPGEFSPLHLHGVHGVGKSHFLQAICHEARRLRPDEEAIYVTGDSFVADVKEAYANKRVDAFREKYRRCRILAFDELQALGQGSKTASQDELLAIIDSMSASGGQLVFASPEAPSEVEGLPAKLRGRLMSGLTDRIGLPGEDVRFTLAANKLAEFGVALPDASLALLARETTGNVRELEGVVKRLAALITFNGMRPTPNCVRVALDSVPRAQPGVALRVSDIVAAVAEEFGVTQDALLGRSRSSSLVRPRRLCMALAHAILGASYAEIGRVFSNRSHATVISAIKSIPEEAFSDALLSRPLERILFRLGVDTSPAALFPRQNRLF